MGVKKKIESENLTASLIASGYEWTCPNLDCEFENTVMACTSPVQCQGCDEIFIVGETNHAE